MNKNSIAESIKDSAYQSNLFRISTISLLLIADAIAISFLYKLADDGVWTLVAALLFLLAGIHIIIFMKGANAYYWLAPGLILLVLFVVYPLLFTLYISMTNYSDGNLLSREQSVKRISDNYEILPGSPRYKWQAIEGRNSVNLLLTDSIGNTFLAIPDESIKLLKENDERLIDPDKIEKLSGPDLMGKLSRIEENKYFSDKGRVIILDLDQAVLASPRYIYDEDQNRFTDSLDGTVYHINSKSGFFESNEGKRLMPGFQVFTGIKNYLRIFTSPLMRGPLLSVFIWTFVFAGLSTLLTFGLGLMMAMTMEDVKFRGKSIIQSILILPQAIPGVISIMIWRGLLNPRMGVINNFLEQLTGGWAPAWFSNPMWAKIAVLSINLWLGYPYMYLVCSGALKAIPRELFEAANVDGVNRLSRFFHITLPMLLVSVGPLLVSTFTFNLNNFNVIYLFNEGGPPIPNTPTPAGHTDILISYTYRLAFASQRGSDYGYAAAITAVIFIILFTVTLINFRFTRIWEEVSENV